MSISFLTMTDGFQPREQVSNWDDPTKCVEQLVRSCVSKHTRLEKKGSFTLEACCAYHVARPTGVSTLREYCMMEL